MTQVATHFGIINIFEYGKISLCFSFSIILIGQTNYG